MRTKKVLVTGGAGFIGSHLVDRLMAEGNEVVVYDDVSQGRLNNLSQWESNPLFRFVKGDVTDPRLLSEKMKGCDAVFHLAANPEVRLGDASVHFHQNVYATSCVLDAAVENDIEDFLFTSSSTVYGEALELPTTEDYSPMFPISTYGSSKLASEAIISGYCHTHNIRGLIFRLANVVGPRLTHGVIFDFLGKLRSNPRTLDVLGDGTQTKSYILADDCIDAMIHLFGKTRGSVEIYNVGSRDKMNVKDIARVVIDKMSLKGVKIQMKGGPDGRGWVGDIKTMWLDISKIIATGWQPRHSSSETVELAAKALQEESSS